MIEKIKVWKRLSPMDLELVRGMIIGFLIGFGAALTLWGLTLP